MTQQQELLDALVNLQKEIRAHHPMNVKKDFSLMVADAQATKAIHQAYKEIAQSHGFNVIPSDDGFAYAKAEGFEGKFPEWFDGYKSEESAWAAAGREATAA